jgi:hypothetical protein
MIKFSVFVGEVEPLGVQRNIPLHSTILAPP